MTLAHLRSQTDPAWAERALDHIDEILVEQAHLEKKAASSALALLFRYPDEPRLQKPLSELAREELTHFESVLEKLQSRGLTFGRQQPSGYAEGLLSIVRGKDPDRLLDRLLCSALIEARSCERMRLLELALADRDPDLSRWYHELVASEARHQDLFVRLAKEIFPADEVERRLVEIADHEARVVASLDPLPRMHT